MPLLTQHDTLRSALENNDLLGTVIPSDFTPSILLSIQYPISGKEVSEGNSLLPEDAKEEPLVQFFAPAGDESAYTLVLTDPDAPSRHDQKFGQWRHWVLPGLKPRSDTEVAESTLPEPGAQVLDPQLFALKTLDAATPYIGPGPGPGTGVHRYTFLLFKEPKMYEVSSTDVGGHTKEERRHWDAMKFAKGKGLELVGANFFLVET